LRPAPPPCAIGGSAAASISSPPATQIAAGYSEMVVAGGMESMSNAPHLMPGARGGLRYGDAAINKEGRLAEEIVPVATVRGRKGDVLWKETRE
jgi:acetyl-CoA acetyltransferase